MANRNEGRQTLNTLPLEDLSSWTGSGSWSLTGDGLHWITGRNGGYPAGADDRLVSSPLVLPELGDWRGKLYLEFEETLELEWQQDFGLVEVSTNGGETWTRLSTGTGVVDRGERRVDLTAFAGQEILLGFRLTSDDTYQGAGWTLTRPQLKTMGARGFTAHLVNCNSAMFPAVNTNVAISFDTDPPPVLVVDDFTLYENGIQQTDHFTVTPPDAGEGTRFVDIVFVIDVTGSMMDEINAVRTNMASFITSLNDAEVDYKIGFVVFGDIYYVYNGGSLYSEAADILDIIDNISIGEHGIGDGQDWPENQLGAMAAAAGMAFRPGAQIIQIMLTDADSHESNSITPWSVPGLIDLLAETDISCYPIFDTYDSLQRNQYIPIAEATNPGGLYFHIYENFNDIIGEISNTVASTYVLNHLSTVDPQGDPVQAVLTITHEGDDPVTLEWEYRPNSSPDIRLTPSLQALLGGPSLPQYSNDVRIEVAVTDDVEPGVQAVTLHYAPTVAKGLRTDFELLEMERQGDGLYAATLPSIVVLSPGVSFYVSATDGLFTVTSPVYDAAENPYSLVVWPNEYPMIDHDPYAPNSIEKDTEVPIMAEVEDSTDSVDSVELVYFSDVLPAGRHVAMEEAESSPGEYHAVIPAEFNNGVVIKYYIIAWDNYGVSRTAGSREDPFVVEPDVGIDGWLSFRVMEADGNNYAERITIMADLVNKDGKPTGKSRGELTRELTDRTCGFQVSEIVDLLESGPFDGARNVYEIRIEKANGVLLGHIPFNYDLSGVHNGRTVDALLFLHNDLPQVQDDPRNSFAVDEGWEFFGEEPEYYVSMLIPPGEDFGDIDTGFGHEPTLMVHGLLGEYPYWGFQNLDNIGQLWSFYYPPTAHIDHCSRLLASDLDYLLDKYQATRVNIIAHSMGNIVTRTYVQDDLLYQENINRHLMLAPPNNGSHSAWKVRYNPGLLENGLDFFFGHDRAGPAYSDLAAGSHFIRSLNANPPRPLATGDLQRDYLVVAGIDHDGLPYEVERFHHEVFRQDDGVVAVSSASLLHFGVPLALSHHWHSEYPGEQGLINRTARAFFRDDYEPENVNWNDEILYFRTGLLESTILRDETGDFDLELNNAMVQLRVPGLENNEYSLVPDGDEADTLLMFAGRGSDMGTLLPVDDGDRESPYSEDVENFFFRKKHQLIAPWDMGFPVGGALTRSMDIRIGVETLVDIPGVPISE